MKNKVLLVNVLLLLTMFAYKSDIYSINNAMHVLALVVLNCLISIFYFIKKEREKGKIFLLAMGLMLLIGFGVCIVKLQIPSFNNHY